MNEIVDRRDHFGVSPVRTINFNDPAWALRPFSNTIFLLKTNVTEVTDKEKNLNVLNSLQRGEKLALVLDENDLHNKRTIVLKKEDVTIGKLPLERSDIIARLLAGGMYLYAKVDATLTDPNDPAFPEEALLISVYMVV